ncbi:MAG: hypothetical protein ONB46_07885 [candidate division KSB1 bacterium]|nr:hypothetical protein [candidate division KSB1 bacterium]MDZ7365811.1 hypothetical protein [candidate division KSB1 bacterium]MDZ7403710.1 hypothetical protein [candidate division KSB1 bacterium]
MLVLWLKLLHLFAVTLAVGGTAAQFIIISKSRQAGTGEAVTHEKTALAVFRALAFPGVLATFLLGLGLAIKLEAFKEPWLHIKMLVALIWVVLAHFELGGLKKMVNRREAGDTVALEKIKSRHLLINKIVVALMVVTVYFAVFRGDAFIF